MRGKLKIGSQLLRLKHNTALGLQAALTAQTYEKKSCMR